MSVFIVAEAFQLDEFGASAEVAYTEPWDAHMVRQCHCLTALGEWPTNTSDVAYRGPFAYAYTDFTGYTCGRAFCPTGQKRGQRRERVPSDRHRL